MSCRHLLPWYVNALQLALGLVARWISYLSKSVEAPLLNYLTDDKQTS